MGFFDKLLGRKPCPKCGNAIGGVFGLCRHCDTYLMRTDGVIVLVKPDRVEDRPYFASPLPWPDVRCVQEGVVLQLSAASALTSLLMTKDGGARSLEAKWPEGCCVCGKPAIRTEPVARKVTIPRFKGPMNVGDQTVTLVVEAVPHCGEHSGGVGFGRVSFATPISFQVYGLLFRSLAYRNAFRALNAWEWRDF